MRAKKIPAPKRAGNASEFVRLASELYERDPRAFRRYLRALKSAAESARAARASHTVRNNRTK